MPKVVRAFGTDGIRGPFGTGALSEDSIREFARALAFWMRTHAMHNIMLARDTRASGEIIVGILTQVLVDAGLHVFDVEIVSTPLLSWLCVHHACDIGIMVTASHNPSTDNGIKCIAGNGEKLSQTFENELLALWNSPETTFPEHALGHRYTYAQAYAPYLSWLSQKLPCRMEGQKIVLDLAHGAAGVFLGDVLSSCACTVITVNNQPTGANINEEAGCLQPEKLAARVLSEKAFCGIAVDGDGDRVVVVDDLGTLWDGDDLLYLLVCIDLEEGIMDKGVVLTLLNNRGLEEALLALGLEVLRTPVGDKYVAQALKERAWSLGGEPCGHIMDYRFTSVSDPVVVILRILRYLQRKNIALSQLPRFVRYPSRSLVIPTDRLKVSLEALQTYVQCNYPSIRWVVRLSGTEPVVRIACEGSNCALLQEALQDICHYAQHGIV